MERIGEPDHSPFIVGIGGTTRAHSTSENLVRTALHHAEEAGAEAKMFSGPDLMMPIYDVSDTNRDKKQQAFVDALRRCDGIIMCSPGYHGSISGHLKNALDYTQDLADDPKAYFGARAVGCIAVGAGHQGANSTLSHLREIVHALRGWPTPLGITVNSTEKRYFDSDGACLDEGLDQKLRYMARQVVVFAVMRFTARAVYPDWEVWPEYKEYFPKLRIEASN
ncbi:NADPH-dependent FMN reductase [Hoeflea sp.]|uniref:NADPH-dependent FMN reductase n=1 Tax=Hoeflea sp. TaxID=1940281 RepID=UPI003B020C51